MDVQATLENLAVDFDVAARASRDRMLRSDRSALATFSDAAKHVQVLRTYLHEMADVVHRTATQDRGGNGRMYIWPGYDSILLENTRITFEMSTDARRELDRFNYTMASNDSNEARTVQTGALYPPGTGIDRATLYYDAALAPLDRVAEETTFTVGGTHNWLAMNPAVGEFPLLGFRTVFGEPQPFVPTVFPTFVLNRDEPLTWGDRLADALNSACGDSPQSFWPMPVQRRGESVADHRARLETEFASKENRDIRQRLYSLWLIGCFEKDVARVLLDRAGRRWLERLIRDVEFVEPERAARLTALRDLETALADGAIFQFEPAVFESLTVMTVPFPIADTRAGTGGDQVDDLGSGMILSDFVLSTPYCILLRQWIAAFYLSLRQQETSVMRAEREAHRKALEAEHELRRQLSHAVGTDLTYVAFLAIEAAAMLSKEQFEPRSALIAARVRNALSEAPLDDTAFGNLYGVPDQVERALADVIGSLPNDSVPERDAELICQSLTVLPAAESRLSIGALADEVRRIANANRALVRVDEATVYARLLRDREQLRSADTIRMVDILRRALVVALTVYFERAYPRFGEAGERVFNQSALRLFGHATDSDEARANVGRDVAHEWRALVATQYRRSGKPPAYEALRRFLSGPLRANAALAFDIAEPGDDAIVARECGENGALVLEAWLTEALLNAMKHCHPPHGADARIRVQWVCGATILSIANTTTEERAAIVMAAADADSRRESMAVKGHQGLPFLLYAARNLFEDRQLYSSYDPATSLLEMAIR